MEKSSGHGAINNPGFFPRLEACNNFILALCAVEPVIVPMHEGQASVVPLDFN